MTAVPDVDLERAKVGWVTPDVDADLNQAQEKALIAAVNCQKALTAVESDRLPALRSKRDEAIVRAVAAGVPAVVLARRMEGKLSESRISQLVKSGNGHG